MAIPYALKTGVYYFRQQKDVSAQQWTALCHAVIQAHRVIRQQPATTGYPDIVICHNGSRALHHDDSLIGPGIMVFNGPAGQSGDTLVLSRFISKSRCERCDTGGHPYDFLVRVIFLLANHFCQGNWEIAADIKPHDWQASIDWIAQYLYITVDFSDLPSYFISWQNASATAGRSMTFG